MWYRPLYEVSAYQGVIWSNMILKQVRLDISIGELDSYWPLFPKQELSISSYQRPLIMITRLFWMYTVSVSHDASSTHNLIVKLGDIDVPTGDCYGKRQYGQKLNGSILIASAEQRTPYEYLALAQNFNRWYTNDTVQLSESNEGAWFALQLAVLILWDLIYA
jgi:hypothetical protein